MLFDLKFETRNRCDVLDEALGRSAFLSTSRVIMTDNFKVGDRVSWNSEAGRVNGTIIRVHTRAFDVKGYTIMPARMFRNMRSRAPRLTILPSITDRRLGSFAADSRPGGNR